MLRVFCERNRAFHKDIPEKPSESLLARTIRRMHHYFTYNRVEKIIWVDDRSLCCGEQVLLVV